MLSRMISIVQLMYDPSLNSQVMTARLPALANELTNRKSRGHSSYIAHPPSETTRFEPASPMSKYASCAS